VLYFSVMGHFIIPYPGMFLYTASKHSVTVLTEGLRKELSDLKSNIRITVIIKSFSI
jgi:NADP-dependent 3-hydroxy acid dehydrogenase YdfG